VGTSIWLMLKRASSTKVANPRVDYDMISYHLFMPRRTVLLIRCSKEEAETIRHQAKAQRRTISNYVLNIVERALVVEERLFAFPRFRRLNRTLALTPVRPPGPRTAMLLQCSVDESKRIRAGAKWRELTISGYILHALRRSWSLSMPGVPKRIGFGSNSN